MPIPKYQRFYQLMIDENKALFDEFQIIHDHFSVGDKNWESKFHEKGRDLVDVIRFWERKLCSGMERGQHAQFSNRLSEKFWSEIKNQFPKIQLVGVK